MNQEYEIVIREHLPPRWVMVFEGMEVRCLPDGSTCIAGSLPDQAALYGLLMRLRDMGLQLLSVKVIDPEKNHEQ